MSQMKMTKRVGIPGSVRIPDRLEISIRPPERPENPSPVISGDWPTQGNQWRTSSNLTEAEWAIVEDYAIRYGCQYDSYLTVRAPGRHFFFASEGKGVVSGVLRGKRMGTFGGILGPQGDWSDVVGELLQHCQEQRWQLGFFAADQDLKAILDQHGFRSNKFGEGAIVDLTSMDWKGKKFEWVRRQTSFCLRQGLKFQEHRESESNAQQWSALTQELLEIERQFLADRSHGSRLRHVVGEFCGKLGRGQRLFTAWNEKAEQTEAFVVCNPSLDGKRWVLECFRCRPEATRGVISFLLHQIMQHLKAEGVEEADLCMIPFVNCDKPIKNDHWLSRKSLSFLGNKLNWIYDCQGLYHFKSRFRPEFRDLHVSVHPDINAGWIHYMVVECGFLKVNPGNVFRQMVRHFFKRHDRANMAKAD